jgi:hypothetical protein
VQSVEDSEKVKQIRITRPWDAGRVPDVDNPNTPAPIIAMLESFVRVTGGMMALACLQHSLWVTLWADRRHCVYFVSL